MLAPCGDLKSTASGADQSGRQTAPRHERTTAPTTTAPDAPVPRTRPAPRAPPTAPDDAEDLRVPTDATDGPRHTDPPYHTPPFRDRAVHEPFQATSCRDHVRKARREPHPLATPTTTEGRYRSVIAFQQRKGAQLPAWRRAQMRYWRKRAKELEPLRRKWRAEMPPTVRKVAGHLHLPLLEEMLAHAGYPDTQLIQHLRKGFPVMGTLPASGVYPLEDPAPTPELHEREFWRKAAADWPRTLAAERPGEFVEHLWKKVQEEVPDGCIEPPTDPSTIRGRKKCVTRRFGKDEGLKADGTPKIRCIDDYTASRVNAATAAQDRIVLQTLDNAVAMARCLENALQKPVYIWKTDHKGAYRQVPVMPAHLQAMYITIFRPGDTRPQVARHAAMPFGAVGAVHGYQRVSEAMTHLGLYLLAVLVQHYVDDFWIVDTVPNAPSGHRAYRELMKLVGFQLEESKTTSPAAQIELLGLGLQFGAAPGDPYRVRVTPARRKKLRTMIRDVLRAGVLSPGEAGKLAGRLGFAAGGLFGRVGRGYLRALYNRQHDTEPKPEGPRWPLDPPLEHALHWWDALLRLGPPRAVQPPQAAQGATPILYTDASEEPAPGGGWDRIMGAVLLMPGQPARAFSIRPPRKLIDALAPRQRHIMDLELITLLVAYMTWRHLLKGTTYSVYIDNDAANRAATTGFSRRDDLARLAALWWMIQARDGNAPWLWRVPSEVNPADWPTRPDDGWSKLKALFPDYIRDTADVDWPALIAAAQAADLPAAAVALGQDLLPHAAKEELEKGVDVLAPHEARYEDEDDHP